MEASIRACQELEDNWEERAQDALCRYKVARDAARAVQLENKHPPDEDHRTRACVQALNAETAALREYRRVLLIFHELVIDGKIPPDEPQA